MRRFAVLTLISVTCLTALVGCGAFKKAAPSVTPTILKFAADSASLSLGGATVLRWETSKADRVAIRATTGANLGTGFPPNGSVDTGSLSQTTIFTLTATSDSGGSVERSLTIAVK
jgi:hypothetical protein